MSRMRSMGAAGTGDASSVSGWAEYTLTRGAMARARSPDGAANATPRPSIGGQLRALLAQQRTQHRAVAMRLVLAIAADREIRCVRKRREQRDRVAVLRGRHLGARFGNHTSNQLSEA